jgi:hypothetical protein
MPAQQSDSALTNMEDQPEPEIMKSVKKDGLHYVAKFNEDHWRKSALVNGLVDSSVENTMFNSTMNQPFNVELQVSPKKSNKNDQKRDQTKDEDSIEFRGV